MDYVLGRKVLGHEEAGDLDMHTWGTRTGACGTVACLAGWALLEAGYTLHGVSYFRPDGLAVTNVAAEAAAVLGMTPQEVRPSGERPCVWRDFSRGPERFRSLVEAAEKAAAERGELGV